MASIRDTLTKLLASDKPEPGTPLARAVGQYPFQQGEAPLEAPPISPDDLIGTGIGKAALIGAGKAMPLLASHTVWHGSPKAFEKFLLEKSGTGSTKQAFGHGIYTSESPSVATKYMGDPEQYITTVDNKVVDTPIVKSIVKMGGNAKSLVDSLTSKLNAQKEILNKASKEELIPGLSDYDIAKLEHDSIISKLNEAKSYVGKNIEHRQSGNLYKLDIPDENVPKMLEWDKPLSQQSTEIQPAISQIVDKVRKLGVEINPETTTGSNLYHQYSTYRGNNPEFASQGLQELGIPGIKYTDQTYGTVAKNPTNYVIFDPNTIQILERNGKIADLLKQ